MARIEISLVFDDRPDGTQAQTIMGISYEGEPGGMQKMTELSPHAAMAYCLAFVHSFHTDVDQKIQASKVPQIQVARMGRG